MYTSRWPIFAVTVDLAIFSWIEGDLMVLVVRRRDEPEAGKLALPGGFVDGDEDLEQAARRELAEETGVVVSELEQLRAYGAPGRDPRGRVVSVAHVAVLSEPPLPRAGSDASEAFWQPIAPLLDGPEVMAFDHALILADALNSGVLRRRLHG